jgi:hypothetical protein
VDAVLIDSSRLSVAAVLARVLAAAAAAGLIGPDNRNS